MSWLGALLLAACATAFAQSEAEIRKTIADRKTTGLVVGVVDGDGARRVVTHGDLKQDSIVEIGSIAKVFTALVLADMVERGEVRLSDPVSKYLPAELVLPAKSRGITLEHLATNMSGLPRLPNNMAMKNVADPYADYTVERLYDFLRAYALPRAPGAKWEYSNLGFGLLGHALARRAANDYETMVRMRVCGPLDMIDTWIELPAQMKERQAKGHSIQLLPVGNWSFTEAVAGAGAFRSDIDDMLEFLAAVLGHKKSGLSPALTAMLRTRVQTGVPELGQLLGWNTATNGDREIVWKDGATAGFSTFIGFDAKRRAGVVVLSSNAGGTAVETGMQLLRGAQ